MSKRKSNALGPVEPESGSMGKMTQEQLAALWQMSPRTLEQWRWLGKGPRFLKIGARVLVSRAGPRLNDTSEREEKSDGKAQFG